MQDLGLYSVEDLYVRLLPALKSKQRELNVDHLNLSIEEIWKYFYKNVWSTKSDLTLDVMVQDILGTSNIVIYRGVKSGNNRG